jgi:hypothetical protein
VFLFDRVQAATMRVSVAAQGAEGQGMGLSPAISADGRCAGFADAAVDLVGGDTNAAVDVFVRGPLF